MDFAAISLRPFVTLSCENYCWLRIFFFCHSSSSSSCYRPDLNNNVAILINATGKCSWPRLWLRWKGLCSLALWSSVRWKVGVRFTMAIEWLCSQNVLFRRNYLKKKNENLFKTSLTVTWIYLIKLKKKKNCGDFFLPFLVISSKICLTFYFHLNEKRRGKWVKKKEGLWTTACTTLGAHVIYRSLPLTSRLFDVSSSHLRALMKPLKRPV